MTAIQFEELLCLVGPKISKQKLVREPISAPARLAMTLRFLATGDSMSTMSYQYLVGRARRTIENSFGIIVSLWRILKKPIDATVENTIDMIQAIICLHNWLRKHDKDDVYIPPNLVIDQERPDGIISRDLRHEVNDSALKDTTAYGNNFSSRSAVAVRDEFCEYLNAEGAVPWQYNRKV
ncbi:Protein of unknown function, partial [Cotesia congregata]